MSPLEQGGLFYLEQGTGLSEAPPAAEETSGEDLGVFSVAAGVYQLGEDWRPDPLLLHVTIANPLCQSLCMHMNEE